MADTSEPLDPENLDFGKELKRYQDLFENAPIGIFQSTLETNQFINLNPAMARLLGYKTTKDCIYSVQNIARDIYVLPQRRRELLEQTIENGPLLNFENKFRKSDGTIIDGKIHARIARKQDGSMEYLEGFFEDVSKQKEVLEALQHNEKHYRSIFKNTGTGTIIVEKDMTISLANDEFLRMTGYERSEVEGQMKWTEIVAFPEDLGKMTTYHLQRRQASGKTPKNYEFTLVDKQGNKKTIMARVDVIPGTGRSVGSFNDMTPMVQAQQSLRENEAQLRGVLEAFEGFIYTCSKNHQVTYLNKNLKNIAGQTIGERSCHEIVFKLATPCEWCPLEAVFTGKTRRQELLCQRTGRWFYAVSSPIFDAGNRVIKMQTVLLDIHERKQAEMDMKAREHSLHKENIKLRAAIKDRYQFCGIVGKSRPMQKIYELILRASKTDANVIIYGESGTGKELVARAIHEMSDRSKENFVPVNCGAIPENLLESEFFGVKKGAFTGATQDRPGFLDHAGKGTLFLDELGEIDLNIQVKLLRVLEGSGYTPVGGRQTKETMMRIIAATNRDLHDLVKQGRIREDFFYRIHILPIYLPPLRERREDIPLLVDHFFKKHQTGKIRLPLSGLVLEELQTHDWPGNVRELENTLHRLVNLDGLEFLSNPTMKPHDNPGGESLSTDNPELSLGKALSRFEKKYVTRMLDHHQWNRRDTAKALSVGRKTLYLKMKALGIENTGQ